MNNINTVIVDIETLDTTATSTIISIGAFAFNRFNINETREDILSILNQKVLDGLITPFYCHISVLDQILLYKRTISRGTVDWFHKELINNNNVFDFTKQTINLEKALRNLVNRIDLWKKRNSKIEFYFRGTDFDPVILKNAFELFDIKMPWKYNEVRDIRTYIDALVGTSKGYIETHKRISGIKPHNALHDAMNDAEQMCEAYEINKRHLKYNLDY